MGGPKAHGTVDVVRCGDTLGDRPLRFVEDRRLDARHDLRRVEPSLVAGLGDADPVPIRVISIEAPTGLSSEMPLADEPALDGRWSKAVGLAQPIPDRSRRQRD